MLVPVLERFAEFGWQLFVEPAETYEFFTVSGVFKRARIDAKLHVAYQPGAQHLIQRNALFDVCLASGLAHLIAAYVRAEEPRSCGAGSNELAAIGLAPTHYVLNEPIAVQQWARRRVEAIERRVNELVADDHFHNGDTNSKEPTQQELETSIRELNGLRSIAMALVERLQDGSRHVAEFAHTTSSTNSTNVDATELSELTRAGMAHLLELLARIQTVATACQVMLWLEEHNVVVDDAQLSAFYATARATRTTYYEQFVDNYGSSVSVSVATDNCSEPQLLIESVMKSANVSAADIGGSCPPTTLADLLQLLHAPSLTSDVVTYYSNEMPREPLEGFFRVPTALLLYFCLDRAYVSALASQVHTGVRIAHKMRALADSLAAQLSVRDDMKLTLLALWLIENAAGVNTGNHDHVMALYDSALALLQQASAMHLHQAYDLEPPVILHVIETLVHRGESVAAWKVATTFGVDLAAQPAAATELAVVMALELELWERALTLLRAQNRSDLLELVLNWLVKSNRMKEFVTSATLRPDEARVFHGFMLHAGVFAPQDALADDNIRRADLLTMFYALRHDYAAAWRVHREHLRMIRDATAGDTTVAAAVLSQPSFRARVALLATLSVEPRDADVKPALERRSSNADVAMDAANDMDEQPLLLTTASTTNSAAAYAPGSFSGHASQPRSASAKKRSVHADGTSDGLVNSSRLGEAAESRLDTHERSRPVAQSLDFDSPRAGGDDNTAPAPYTFSFAAAANDSAFSSRLAAVNQPLRSRFNSSFHGATAAAAAAPHPNGATTDDLTLKPRSLQTSAIELPPVNVHVASRRSVLDTASVVPQSSPSASSTLSTATNEPLLETPKRFQFVREPMTDSRIGLGIGLSRENAPLSPATAELDAMEIERIDEEFSTPMSRARSRRTEPASVPERRNPRRSARNKY